MGLLLGQVSKWRAQRADRGAHAARGFVAGATRAQKGEKILRLFQCRTRLCGWCSFMKKIINKKAVGFNAARGFVGGAATCRIPMETLLRCFNAARGFVGGAARD